MAPRDIRTNAVVQRYYCDGRHKGGVIITRRVRSPKNTIEQLPATSCQKKADAFTFPAPRVSVAGGLLAGGRRKDIMMILADDLASPRPSLDRCSMPMMARRWPNGRMNEGKTQHVM